MVASFGLLEVSEKLSDWLAVTATPPVEDNLADSINEDV